MVLSFFNALEQRRKFGGAVREDFNLVVLREDGPGGNEVHIDEIDVAGIRRIVKLKVRQLLFLVLDDGVDELFLFFFDFVQFSLAQILPQQQVQKKSDPRQKKQHQYPSPSHSDVFPFQEDDRHCEKQVDDCDDGVDVAVSIATEAMERLRDDPELWV